LIRNVVVAIDALIGEEVATHRFERFSLPIARFARTIVANLIRTI